MIKLCMALGLGLQSLLSLQIFVQLVKIFAGLKSVVRALSHLFSSVLSSSVDNSRCFTRRILSFRLGSLFISAITNSAMFVEDLKHLDFSENEARAYLMLLRVGPSPVSALAARLGMKRATVYAVLNALCSRGLITFEEGDNCKKFVPYDPECILFGLEKQRAELNFRMELAKVCIAKMQNSLVNEETSAQKVVFFRGCSTISRVLLERLDKSAPVSVFFLNFGEGSVLAKCLTKFLNENIASFRQFSLFVQSGQCARAQTVVPSASCYELSQASLLHANLILQDDDVFFLLSREGDIQMMHIRNPGYAKYLQSILLSGRCEV